MIFLLTLISALGCGLIAGVFFAFSAFVMPALARIPPAQGIAAMQSINVTALRWPLMAAFFGTAASCALLAGGSFFWRQGPLDPYLTIGGSIYLAGTLLVTVLFNVPRNEKLAGVGSDSAEAAELWSRYLAEWTAWNHLRAFASLLAAALLTIAL
jgi:uncharacterized membrane protein